MIDKKIPESSFKRNWVPLTSVEIVIKYSLWNYSKGIDERPRTDLVELWGIFGKHKALNQVLEDWGRF